MNRPKPNGCLWCLTMPIDLMFHLITFVAMVTFVVFIGPIIFLFAMGGLAKRSATRGTITKRAMKTGE